MEKQIQFSIIIPAFNEEKYIAKSIKFAQEQQGGFDMEIIVVNNASTDKTKQIAESLGVLVVDEPKKGVGQARKTGTEVARGEYILHIDADTHLPEDYLQQVYKRFQKDSELVCLGGQFYFYDANLFWCVTRFFLFYPFYWFAKFSLRKSIGPIGNGMVFKKTTYQKTAGFDPELKYGEDFDINQKLANVGEIKLDLTLKYFISSRRFKLFNRDFWSYVANFFNFCFKKEIRNNELSSHK